MPPCVNFFSKPASFFLRYASRPFVGSSRSSIFASRSSNFPSAALCISPPLKSYGCMEILSESSRNSAISFARSTSCPALSRSSSHTVSYWKSTCGLCGSMAIRSPFSRITLPRRSFIIPVSIFNNVLFPAPFPPRRANISPLYKDRSRLLKMSTPLLSYRNQTSFARRTMCESFLSAFLVPLYFISDCLLHLPVSTSARASLPSRIVSGNGFPLS